MVTVELQTEMDKSFKVVNLLWILLKGICCETETQTVWGGRKGQNTSGTLLYNASGSTIPPTLTATSGSMYFVFYSDSYYTFSGFEAFWTSVVPAGTGLTADYTISDTNPPLNSEVQFNDQTIK